jgi:hypothetical protein
MQLHHGLKAPGFNPSTWNVKTRFQSLLLNATCSATARLTLGRDEWTTVMEWKKGSSVVEPGGAVQVESTLPIACESSRKL